MRSFSDKLSRISVQRSFISYLLWPLSLLYRAGFTLRRWAYRSKLVSTQHFDVPVIVVGNITVGGTGKTPVVSAIVRWLHDHGWKPGIVSRGYGGDAQSWPQDVRAGSTAGEVGDEPVLLARQTQRPVVVGPDRPAAVGYLLAHHDCDVVVADDGLQHLALERDVEIAVVDSVRKFGNGFCLPAGPLRESPSRLDSVDFVIYNPGGEREFNCKLVGTTAVSLIDPDVRRPLTDFKGHAVRAVAGIGNPDRFFQHLKNLGLDIKEHAFTDHYRFQPSDFDFESDVPILMTEKDAVKCTAFAQQGMWYVPVEAELCETFYNQLVKRLR